MKRILLLILLISAPSSLLAQSGGFAGAHTRMGFSPRGMAMGNAMVSVADEGIYPYHNPALAASVVRTQIDITSAVMGFGRSLNTLGAALRLPPNAGIYVGLLNANVKNIDGRTSSGYHTRMYSIHDYQLITSFGIKPGEKVQLGATLKLNMADYHEEVSASPAFGMDFGILVKATDKLNVGFSVQDLFAETVWNTTELYGAAGSSNKSNAWPTRVTLGSSYRATNALLLSAEVEQRVQTSSILERTIETDFDYPTSITQEKDITTSSQMVRIGARHRLHERFSLRAGYQIGDLNHVADQQRMSLGFSVHLPLDVMSPSVDYSVVREPGGLSYIHAFAIRLQL